MFTGLVEDVGQVAAVTPLPSGTGRRIGIEARLLEEEVALGASVCVDGVCLTAVGWRPGRIDVEAGPETLARTTLGALGPGDAVNLERALRLGDRLGGHLVAGHVDGVGTVLEVRPRGEALDLRVGAPPALLRYVVHKGSIAVDGVSLTVNTVDDGAFSISLIPHTQARTTLGRKAPGGRVNLEVDIIGKYVERLLVGYPATGPPGLTLEKLKEHGFVPPE